MRAANHNVFAEQSLGNPHPCAIDRFPGCNLGSNLIYKEKLIAAFDPSELVDLEEVVRRMASSITDESYAKLPPDEG